jgi:rhamnosyltransferase
MSRVIILMSTWNGEKFLDDQLNSIFNQSFCGELEIIIRDDGSKDNTISILKNYQKKHNITIIYGNNIGTKNSFFELMRIASQRNADFFAFADQDDVWLPDKISNGVETLMHLDDKPALYCSALNVVDSDLNQISIYQHSKPKSIISTLISNFATGCSCIFNRQLLKVILYPVNSNSILMHDWWIALIATAYGVVKYDSIPHILYRQHAGNQIGVFSKRNTYLARLKRFFRSDLPPSRLSQALELQATYGGTLPHSSQLELDEFLSSYNFFIKRIRFVFFNRSSINFLSKIRFIIKGLS